MVRCRWGSALFVARPLRRSQIDIGRGAAHSEPLAGQRHDLTPRFAASHRRDPKRKSAGPTFVEERENERTKARWSGRWSHSTERPAKAGPIRSGREASRREGDDGRNNGRGNLD
jgi:hypothetical protein